MKKIIIFMAIILAYIPSNSQVFEFIIKLKKNKNIETLKSSEVDKLNIILKKYNFEKQELIPCYPKAKNPELLLYYNFKGNGNKNAFKEEIKSILSIDYITEETIFYITDCENPAPPVNDTYIVNNLQKNWALEMIEANCAWAITHGNKDIIIGIADTEFEVTHEDLTNQIIKIFGNSTGGHPHGTKVAGCVSAQTNNLKGIAGIGYNCKIKSHCIPHSPSGSASSSNIRRAIWNLYLEGVDVINCSWTGTGLNVAAAEEITQSGIILCLSAGNTPSSYNHSLIANVPGVLVISGVDSNNEHGPTNYAHNDLVDICAPSSDVLTTKSGNTYGSVWGTSYASPITAGTIALMLSVNECLTSEDIEFILKASADSINDSYLFPGQLGSGRLNAYKAVSMAQNYSNDITINNIQIWNNSNSVSYHNINIANNGVLYIQADIKIPDCATITIDEGGQLIIDGGSFINMSNDNWKGTMYINGTLKINNDYIFVSSGSGYIYLNGNINAEPGATLTIQGVNKNTKLLVVNKKIEFSNNFNSVTIKNGKIVMNNTYAELYINSGVDNVTIDNVRVTSNSYRNNGHEGIDIRSNGNITVKNSTFEKGYYGVYTVRQSTAPVIKITNCNFKYCNYGLRAYNSGVGISGCIFEHNRVKGIYCSSMDKQSYIYNTSVRYQSGSGDYGVYYEGSTSASLSLFASSIYQNYYGIFVSGNFTTSFNCSSVNDNTINGIRSTDSDIYLASASGISAGNNFISGNKTGLSVQGNVNIVLNNGDNDLRNTDYCIAGVSSFFSHRPPYIFANNNRWRNDGRAPNQNRDYSLYYPNDIGYLFPVTIRDNSPENYWEPCQIHDIGETFNRPPSAGSYSYRTVTTSAGTLPLNKAVDEILYSGNTKSKSYTSTEQYNLLAELFSNNLKNLNKGEEWYVHHAYNMFKSLYGGFDKPDTDNTGKLLTVINKLDSDLNGGRKASRISPEKYSLNIDKANTLWYSGNYTEAIELLNNMLYKVNDSVKCELKKMICRINVDKAFIESNNSMDIDEALAVCQECQSETNNNKSGSTEQSNGNSKKSFNAKTDKSGKYSVNSSNCKLTVIPNPVSGESVITVSATAGAEIVMYNGAGQLIFKDIMSANIYNKTISSTDLNQGIYIVMVRVNGVTVQSKKVVVTK